MAIRRIAAARFRAAGRRVRRATREFFHQTHCIKLAHQQWRNWSMFNAEGGLVAITFSKTGLWLVLIN